MQIDKARRLFQCKAVLPNGLGSRVNFETQQTLALNASTVQSGGLLHIKNMLAQKGQLQRRCHLMHMLNQVLLDQQLDIGLVNFLLPDLLVVVPLARKPCDQLLQVIR